MYAVSCDDCFKLITYLEAVYIVSISTRMPRMVPREFGGRQEDPYYY